VNSLIPWTKRHPGLRGEALCVSFTKAELTLYRNASTDV
jgi:hypothetical protein